MSVRIVSARSGKGYEYDVRFTWPEGGRLRERGKCPTTGKDASRRWAEAREAVIRTSGKAAYTPLHTPLVATAAGLTLADFWPRVVTDHYEANRKKPSTIDAAKSIYRLHLEPPLGAKPLGGITTADVAALKGTLSAKGPKTVNNVLSVLSRALHCAVDWDVLPAMPCRIGLLKIPPGTRDWYELGEYRRLVDASRKIGTDTLVLILLAGSAGLRRGEIMALKWTDLDLPRRMIHVQRAIWQGQEESPKGGRGRMVPMTPELADALKAHRHLKGERVLYSEKGLEISNRCVRTWLHTAQRRAGLPLLGASARESDRGGAIHILRHTFCSHLAAAGAPAKAIQELAGHADLQTTQRYMHLSPSNRSDAMEALARYHGVGRNEDSAPCAPSRVC